MGPKRRKNQTREKREIPLLGETVRGSGKTLYKKTGARITLIRDDITYYRLFGTFMHNFRRTKMGLRALNRSPTKLTS